MTYNPRVTLISDTSQAAQEMGLIGCDPAGISLMGPKAVFRTIRVDAIPLKAANILKQEMLAVGGDAAVSRGAAGLTAKATDMLLMATLRQFQILFSKLRTQYFGLPELAIDLADVLACYDRKEEFEMDCRGNKLTLGKKTLIMGVLNVTPDSFSDGGKFLNPEKAIFHAKRMEAEGADIIDIGGESTRPGSKPVDEETEMERIGDVIDALVAELRVPISIDTMKASVAKFSLERGVNMINDVSGLRFDKDMARLVADYDVPVVIMHMLGEPKTMQENPTYESVVGDISRFFRERVDFARSAGISKTKIILDPGLGFGKTTCHNLEIIRRLGEFGSLGYPLLVGPSRKKFIGDVLDVSKDQRLEGTLAAVTLAATNGADIIRVHDVLECARAVKVAGSIACVAPPCQ